MKFGPQTLCFLLAASVSAKPRPPKSVVQVAIEASRTNPKLRAGEKERQNRFKDRIRALANVGSSRALGNNNNNQNNNNNNQNNNNNNKYANYNWDWDASMAEEDIGFDISSYAIKYTGCTTVQSYSDELAETYSYNVLAAHRFATFRLCPADTCSSYSNNGCASDYGDYVVSLDQYLAAMSEMEEERVTGYCEYCQECATIEAAKSFYREVEQARENTMQYAEYAYETWQEQYADTYGDDGNGDGASAMAYFDYVRKKNKYANGNNYANNYASNVYYYGGNSNNNGGNYNNNGGNYNNNGGNYNNNGGNNYNGGNYNYGNNANYQYRNNYNGANNGGYQGQYNNYYQPAQDAWTQEEYWNSQTSQNKYSQNYKAWNNMAYPQGTFFGMPVYNGYYDENGDFNDGWGYFNFYGEYMSLEEEDMEWDEGLWGEQPDGWDEITMDTDSCNYQYAGSCANQYDACMQILQQEDYNQEWQGNRATLKDFLECTQIDIQQGNNYWNNNNAAANQDYYQQRYQYKQQQNNNYNNCEDGENCGQQAYNNAQNYYQQQYQQREYYIGPFCKSNGHDISLAVYSDEYCSVKDDTTSIEDLLGYSVNTDSLDLVPEECIACGIDDEYANDNIWYEGEDYSGADSGIEPMCSMLYQLSGKCNKNLQNSGYNQANNDQNAAAGDDEQNEYWNENYGQYSQMYQSEQQYANEESVCAFITSLKSNSYNSNGEVVLNGSDSNGKWSLNQSIAAQSRNMTAGMKAAIVLCALAVCVMAVWACFLHGALARKNIPWRPRRGKGEDATDIARQNSGIVMGRSRSGAGTSPLI